VEQQAEAKWETTSNEAVKNRPFIAGFGLPLIMPLIGLQK